MWDCKIGQLKGGICINKYKKVEHLLYNYKMLEISILNLKKDIEHLDKEYGLKGINFDGISTSPTNVTSDSTADIALCVMEHREKLQQKIERNKRKLESVDKALEGLEEIERVIIKEKYIEAKQWWQVATVVRYSESWCRAIRTKAINKLVIGIFG